MNSIKTVLLLGALTGLLVGLGQYFGGNQGMMVMFAISLGMNFYSYWFSDKMILRAYGAQPITKQEAPELYGMVEELAKRANLPMPKVCIINSDVPNAFATGRNPQNAAVAATTGLLKMLTNEEIAGVLAHELSHIKHRDTLISTVAASIAGMIAMLANMLQFFAIFGSSRDDNRGGNPIALIATIILAPIAATMIQMAISRSREYMADAGAAEMTRQPLALASALKKIEAYAKQRVLPHAQEASAHMFIINPLSGVAKNMASLFSTHPSTTSRVEKLEELAKTIR